MIKSNRYIDRFLKLHTSSEILAENVFPNSKEITESMGAFVAVKDNVSFNRGDDSVQCIVVGDGSRPRTGILFARLTKWQVHSIDPRMKIKNYHTDRLYPYKERIENLNFSCDKAIIVAVHSHADAQKTIDAIQAKEKYFINIPCCVPCNLREDPIKSYRDEAIHSPVNEVNIYYYKEKV